MLNFQELFGKGGGMGRKRFSPEQIIVKLREAAGEYVSELKFLISEIDKKKESL